MILLTPLQSNITDGIAASIGKPLNKIASQNVLNMKYNILTIQ